MSKLFWLSDDQWAAVEPHLPRNQAGARRVDDRRVISGIIHVLKIGCRWQDCPAEYGPSTTVYNRFNRWSHKRFWLKLLEALADAGAVTRSTSIDSTYVKAQRSAFGGKGGARTQGIGPSRGGQTTKVHALTDVVGRPFALILTPGNVSDITVAPTLLARAPDARYVLADKGYDADGLRRSLRQTGAVPVIPGRANRKRAVIYDKARYKERHRVENAFCRIKDYRRVATRYDKLAANFLSGVALAILVAFWL
ncbi:IS5 family transposase [Haematobacter massiliensis]|uniref:IS5 family transposase n=1 Tax=Haematobacter massiliensis TaxID=195105 RepID=UPI001040356D|nr:IS5 family transposase [Haematobacter massiliensis]QBJ25707.1 IS5 family transposase [Haematobacter massiliensis]QBJ26388.1 IS5 family transposase [Haematobacter massiliensis]